MRQCNVCGARAWASQALGSSCRWSYNGGDTLCHGVIVEAFADYRPRHPVPLSPGAADMVRRIRKGLEGGK